jgi:hypothetical protein
MFLLMQCSLIQIVEYSLCSLFLALIMLFMYHLQIQFLVYVVEFRSVKPLLSSSELSTTERLVQDFGEGDGPKLQKLLEDRAKRMDSWV